MERAADLPVASNLKFGIGIGDCEVGISEGVGNESDFPFLPGMGGSGVA
jgi:hypothetical protein